MCTHIVLGDNLANEYNILIIPAEGYHPWTPLFSISTHAVRQLTIIAINSVAADLLKYPISCSVQPLANPRLLKPTYFLINCGVLRVVVGIINL